MTRTAPPRRWWLLLVVLGGCATFYQRNLKFNQAFEQGKLEQAQRLLDHSSKWAEGRHRLLYFLNQGVVTALQGDHAASNTFFETAHQIAEDQRKNYAQEALALLANPQLTTYGGEDHELLLIHYYKALNFLQMGQRPEALVECRRLNIRLQQLSDRYASEKKYRRDAFIHLLMGLIYEADGDHNNAFIAYRNAVSIYEEDFGPMFGVGVPAQLQDDVIRAAYRTGFDDEGRRFEQHFGRRYQPPPAGTRELVFFWHNGLGPVKSEWSLNFAVVRGQGGQFTFVNEQLGLNFPFRLEPDKEDRTSMDDLRIFRVAFPRYVERPPAFRAANLEVGGRQVPLQRASDLNGIAFKVLEQRMFLEFGKGLLRVALKQAAELGTRKKDENLGAVLGIFNALTERADTRNWQTLPHTIHYARVVLPTSPQAHAVKLDLEGPRGRQTQTFDFSDTGSPLQFHAFHSLEAGTFPPRAAF